MNFVNVSTSRSTLLLFLQFYNLANIYSYQLIKKNDPANDCKLFGHERFPLPKLDFLLFSSFLASGFDFIWFLVNMFHLVREKFPK